MVWVGGGYRLEVVPGKIKAQLVYSKKEASGLSPCRVRVGKWGGEGGWDGVGWSPILKQRLQTKNKMQKVNVPSYRLRSTTKTPNQE